MHEWSKLDPRCDIPPPNPRLSENMISPRNKVGWSDRAISKPGLHTCCFISKQRCSEELVLISNHSRVPFSINYVCQKTTFGIWDSNSKTTMNQNRRSANQWWPSWTSTSRLPFRSDLAKCNMTQAVCFKKPKKSGQTTCSWPRTFLILLKFKKQTLEKTLHISVFNINSCQP